MYKEFILEGIIMKEVQGIQVKRDLRKSVQRIYLMRERLLGKKGKERNNLKALI